MKQKIFKFLVELRDSGRTNMWGATPYIMDEFDMEMKEAGEWLLKWIRTFDVFKNQERYV